MKIRLQLDVSTTEKKSIAFEFITARPSFAGEYMGRDFFLIRERPMRFGPHRRQVLRIQWRAKWNRQRVKRLITKQYHRMKVSGYYFNTPRLGIWLGI